MAVRNRGPAALPAAAGQLGRGGGLIEKDKLRRIEPGLPGDPGLALRHYIGAVLFPGMRRPNTQSGVGGFRLL